MEKFGVPTIKERAPQEIVREGLTEILNFESEENFIDSGGIGYVYELPGGYCMKLVEDRHNSPNRHLFDLGNTAYQEGRFQERMSHTQFDGVTRVPRLFGVQMAGMPDSKHMLLMERLPAINLQHIIKGREKLPEGFDIQNFFSDLERFVNHMHQNEGICHNDLFARNIMVDTTTGAPYVIDFGRAVSRDKVKSEDVWQRMLDVDWENLDDAYNDLNALQN